MIYGILYLIGVVICFYYLNKKHEVYTDWQYAIMASLLSWITLIALLAGDFCAFGDGDDEDDEYIEDSYSN